MKLAMISPAQCSTPPVGYGGIERVCDIMVRELMELGHTVDLYAGPGSTCPATNLYMSQSSNLIQGEKELAEMVKSNQDKYNCIIDSGACHFTSLIIQSTTPRVALMTGDAYRKYPHYELLNRIYVSKEYAEEMDAINNPYINNVISKNPEKDFPLGDGSGGYAAVYSTIGVQKGVHIAVKASMIAGLRLKVAGPIQDYSYWNGWCKAPNVEYIGVITKHEDKIKFLGDARLLFFMSTCGEGDALTPKEAMACGTPVVATPQNGIKSFLEPAINGFYAMFPDDAAKMAWAASSLDRKLVRQSALEKLDPKPKAIRLAYQCERAFMGATW